METPSNTAQQASIKRSNFPAGPLDVYRKQATFNCNEMKVFLDGGEDLVEFKEEIWRTIEKDPLFRRDDDYKLSFDELRRITMKRCQKVFEYNFLTEDDVLSNPMKAQVFVDALGAYDWSTSAKYMLNRTVTLFGSSMLNILFSSLCIPRMCK